MKKRSIFYSLLLLFVFQAVVFSALAQEKPFVVCIDAGHQAKGDAKKEASSPLSGRMKARVSSGTVGVGTKKPEYKVNLEAALLLKELLNKEPYQVVMTRETHDVNISNQERAAIANKAQADMTIRLHCDSIANASKTGATLLVPSKESKETKAIYEKSYQYATLLKEQLQQAGIKVNGIFERKDITGFNWSTVPVVIFEMGFMSNHAEDANLNTPSYQQKLMQAVFDSLEVYRNLE